MKKILLLFAAFCLAIAGSAQTKTYSANDSNLDGKVDISDVNSAISEICGTSSGVSVISVDSVCALASSIDPDFGKQLARKLITGGGSVTSSNLLPGKFSVSATKQVQFTKSNLYWDGSDFKFEANQTDYPTAWDACHVGHFYWNSITDCQSGNAYYMPYAMSYNYRNRTSSDKFWCGEANPLTVDGADGLYALTGGESGEWNYLIKERANASSLYKCEVTVTNGETSYANCLIIAPDDFTGELQSSYTLDDVNAAGLVCLPPAGCRKGSSVYDGSKYGDYWSATCYMSLNAYDIIFSGSAIVTAYCSSRDQHGCSIRLVRDI